MVKTVKDGNYQNGKEEKKNAKEDVYVYVPVFMLI